MSDDFGNRSNRAIEMQFTKAMIAFVTVFFIVKVLAALITRILFEIGVVP